MGEGEKKSKVNENGSNDEELNLLGTSCSCASCMLKQSRITWGIDSKERKRWEAQCTQTKGAEK
jgi:hypothetical protein